MADGRSVVDGAFRVLRALPATGPERQLAGLARLTSLPRPTVHRLLGQLAEVGAVEWRDGRWVLAAGLLGLAQRVEPLAGLRESAAVVIQALHDETGAAVSLVVPGGDAYVALEMVPGRDPLPIDARAGAAMPAGTAAGVVLSGTPGPRRRRFGAAVDDQHVYPGMTCYAVPVRLPGGHRAALQIATGAGYPAERAAAPVHRAAAALERRFAA
ncbi:MULTISPECIES: helix-turn-helix domain-containing protein [Catenuloplanes]|uniref:DNA-binding IclR family transcriptional regulator n=1 Tax=Catenuloplanes niger TaxID=587534 RepID=A0AAE3ZME5_9ACTN|nr:helix-turn-helix domain-containing protein [Catenuloplanes niger]MDR7320535.1 DNA-binding IclR family transcriptional regulator [Catenuloplanes niger]